MIWTKAKNDYRIFNFNDYFFIRIYGPDNWRSEYGDEEILYTDHYYIELRMTNRDFS